MRIYVFRHRNSICDLCLTYTFMIACKKNLFYKKTTLQLKKLFSFSFCSISMFLSVFVLVLVSLHKRILQYKDIYSSNSIPVKVRYQLHRVVFIQSSTLIDEKSIKHNSYFLLFCFKKNGCDMWDL